MRNANLPFLRLAIVALLFFAAHSAYATTFTWNGGTADWTTPTAWTPNGVPSGTDAAIINSGTCTVSTPVVVQDLTFSGGTINGGGTLTIGNFLTWTSGTMTGAGTTTATNSLSIISTSGAPILSRTFNYSGAFGSLSGTGTFTVSAGAVWNIQSGGVVDCSSDVDCTGTGTINNAGTFKKTGGTLTTDVSPAFNNTGTVQCSSGTLALGASGTHTSATFTTTGGTISFAGTHTLNAPSNIGGSGNFTVVSGAVVTNSGNYAVSGTTTLAGTLNLALASSTGTLTINSGGVLGGAGNLSVATLNFNGGQMGGTGTTTISTGTLNINTSAGSPILARALNFDGNATMTGANPWVLNTGGVFTITAGGIFDCQSDAGFTAGGGSISSDGTFKKSAGTLTNVNVPFTNTSTVLCQSGTLSFNGGSNHSVFSCQAAAGATIAFGGGNHNFTGGATLGGAGSVLVSTGTVTTNGSINVGNTMTVSGGTLSYSGTFTTGTLTVTGGVVTGGNVTVNTAINFSGGSMAGAGTTTLSTGPLTINSSGNPSLSRTLTFGGSGTLSGSGSLTLGAGGILNILSGATIDCTGNASIGTVGSINNAGTFRKTGGTSTSIGSPFTNTGTVVAQLGTLSFQTTTYTQTSGTTSLSGGNMTGPLNIQGGSLTGFGTITGNVTANGLTGIGSPGTPSTLAITGNFTQASTSTLFVEIGGTNPGTQFGVLSVSGTATLAGALNVSLINGFVPANGSTFQILSCATRSGTLNFTSPTFAGTGTFTPTYSATALALTANGGTPAPVITSALTANATVGTPFSYTITASNSPTFFSASNFPGSLTFNAGTATLSGTPSAAGTFNITIQASNAGGTDTKTLVLTVAAATAPPVITSSLTANATVGTPFSYTITATNSPTSFSASNFPGSLTFNAGTATLSGTPTASGTSNITIQANNAGGTDTKTLVLTVSAATAPVITSPLTASATVGTPFSYTITASNSPTSFSASNFPASLTFNAGTATLSGTPTASGTSNITLLANNAGGTDTKTLVLTVVVATISQPPVISDFSSATNPGFPGKEVAFSLTATDPDSTSLTFQIDFADGTPIGSGSFAPGGVVPIPHVFATTGNFNVKVTVSDGSTSVSQTLLQNIPEPASGGQGVPNVSDAKPPVTNPLNGLTLQVAKSDGGVVQLDVNIDSLNRAAFNAFTEFSDIPGRSSTVLGLSPVHKFIQHGLFIAKTTAKNATTGVASGIARKMLAISSLETGEAAAKDHRSGRAIGTAPSNAINTRALKGKFIFNAGKNDLVSYSGTITLPAGIDPSQPHEFSFGIGNIIVNAALDKKGKGTATDGTAILKSLKVTYKKIKKGALSVGGEIAQVDATLFTAGLVAAGFDTEGISHVNPDIKAGGKGDRKIQVAMLLDGVAYETQAGVTFAVSKDSEFGTIASRN